MRTEPEVLLVDDNPADIDLTSDALSRCRHAHRVRSVNDGAEAVAFLRREGKYADVPEPDLVILDLNLPRKDGRAVLAEVKSDPRLRKTPIIIFSTSQAASDVGRSFELGANSYVTKPGNLQEFIATVTTLGEFWFGCVQLPPKEDQDQ
jgi:two-component system, chemotaxis family, response regulator Rcp1